MKNKGKSTFFVVAALILALAYTAFFGVRTQYGDITTTKIKGASDIRFGIDIRGGVDVTFSPANGFNATDDQLESVQEIMKMRLVNLAITDYEIYTDPTNDHIIVRFPWREDEVDFNPEQAIEELGASAVLTFREGLEVDSEGKPTGTTLENIIIEGADVKEATAVVNTTSSGTSEYAVQLTLNDSGKESFAQATEALLNVGTISIWMDDEVISNANVQAHITDGNAVINGNFTADEAVALANKINAGALPFALEAESYSSISPTLGAGALQAMLLAGAIALVLVFAYMIYLYRLAGFVACIALIGQLAGTIAAISGYMPAINSFTLTLPGIAGILLSIGMAVDANIITAERIKEELQKGKTLDGAINAGFSRGLAPVIDGNITVLIVAAVLMGAFGPSSNIFAKILSPFFFMFGASTTGLVYSFGYTLLVGVILNLVMGVGASRLMLRSLSKFPALRNPALYGNLNSKDEKEIDFVKATKTTFKASGAILALVLVFSLVMGVKMDIQFKGGSMVSYSYTGEIDASTVESEIENLLGSDVQVQTGSALSGESNTLTVSLAGSENITVEQANALLTTLQSEFAANEIEQMEISNVSPTMGRSFFAKSALSVVLAAAFILCYIALRFKNIGGFSGGAMAIVALLHDLVLVFGVYSLLRIPLNGNFIAALLTVLGYSINDTVVIYDRIRENKALYGKTHSFTELVNMSINQSKVRSLRTTITTTVPLLVACVVTYMAGITSISIFTLTLAIGMVSGVYSSFFIAGPLWTKWEERKGATPAGKKKSKKKKGTSKL